jgi:hypothetical protein
MLCCHFLFLFFLTGKGRMYTVDRIFPAEPEEPSGGGGEEEPVLSPGVAGRRLVAAPSPRLRLVAKSGALNVISEHLTWWNPLSFNNAIRHLLLALYGTYLGVTKRCRLSWMTNSALVYEPKCVGRGHRVGTE